MPGMPRTGPIGLLLALAILAACGIACLVVAATVPQGGPAILGTMAAGALTPAVLHEA